MLTINTTIKVASYGDASFLTPGSGRVESGPGRGSVMGHLRVLAATLLLLLSCGGGSAGECVDGSLLFERDEVGYGFVYCDDDGDGDFDRTIRK